MLTQTLNTQAINTQVRGKIAPAHPVSDQFGAITGHVGLVATEFSYRKDEEIYGEDEPAEYVYQVVSGAVRTYKLLSDGRRQIGAFHLPGDVFGLESGPDPPPRRRSHHRHQCASREAREPREGRRHRRAGRPQALGHDRRRAAPRRRPHAAAGTQDRDGARRDLPARNGSPPCGSRHDGAADVPPRHRRLSRPDARDRVARAVAASRPGHFGISPAPARSCCATARACTISTPDRFVFPHLWPADLVQPAISFAAMLVRRVSGITNRISNSPVAATLASPKNAVALPNMSLT